MVKNAGELVRDWALPI